MFFKNKKIIGLDIGSSSIKIAELNVRGKNAELVSFAMVPTPEGGVSGGDITNVSAIASSIQTLIGKIKSKRKKVATGMWGTAVIVKKISIAKMDKKLLSKQISWEAEQYIPFDLGEIALDFEIIKSSPPGDLMDVLLVAAQNALISQYVSAVSTAGLEPTIIDVNSFALANLFLFNYGSPPTTVGLVNIGAHVVNFVVISKGDVVFSRDIPVGGANYTNEISKELGLSFKESESLKLSASAGREVPEQVNSIISVTNELIADEIRNSFEFFAAGAPGLQIEQCLYTGGGAATAHLIQKIVQATGVNFQPINPFQKFSFGGAISQDYAQQIIPYSSVALGLALRKENDR